MGNNSSNAKHKVDEEHHWMGCCVTVQGSRSYQADDLDDGPTPRDQENKSPEQASVETPKDYDSDQIPRARRQQSAPTGTAVFTREPSNKRLSIDGSDDYVPVNQDVHVEAIPDDVPASGHRGSVSVSDNDGFKRSRIRDARNSFISLRKQIPNSLLSNLSPDLFNQLEKVSDEIIQLLQNEYLSAHLREMRDRREFLMRAANDLTVPDAEREVARWLSSTYLRRSEPVSNVSFVLDRAPTVEPTDSRSAGTPETGAMRHTESQRLLSIDENLLTETGLTPEVAHLLKNINSWDFDVFEMDKCVGRECVPIIMQTILTQRNFFSSLGLDKKQVYSYFQAVAAAYKDNPYHNYLHGCDVVVSMHFFMQSDAFRHVEELDAFSILLASVCHDVGHPGNNNLFEINTESELAITYNDTSVLEHFHIALAWRLMKKTDCDVLQGLTKEQKRRVRSIMIMSILATDMTKHVESARTLDELVQIKKGEANGDWRQTTEFLPLALHTADIGNPAKPLQFYSLWVNRLMQEFFAQGDVERNLGLSISQLCDRRSVDIPSGQVGFINFVVRPWFTSWSELLCESDQGPYFLQLIDENYQFMDTKRSDIESTKDSTTEPDLPESPVLEEKASEANSIPATDTMRSEFDVNMNADSIRSVASETEKSVRFSVNEPAVSPREQPPAPTLDEIESDGIVALRDRPSGRNTPHSRSSKSYSIVTMTMSEIQNRLGEIRGSGQELPAVPDENEETE